jgi:DNA-directed RNA polymerase specialized sigma24 family protein
MVTTNDPVLDDAYVVVASSANTIARDFRGFVSADDLAQEMWIWVLKHRNKVEEWLVREDKIERAKGHKALFKTLLRHGHVYARKEKAKTSGYHPRDEYFYTKPLVISLIEAIYNEGVFQVNIVDDTPRKSKLDSEGNDLLAMLSDVQVAIASLEENQQALISSVYGYGISPSEIAEHEGVTRQAVDNRVNRALERIIKELGGEYPYS